MNLTQLNEGRIDEAQVVCRGGDAFPDDFDGRLEVQLSKASGGDAYLLNADNRTWMVDGVDESDCRTLERIGNANLPRVVWVRSRIDYERVHLQVHSFCFELVGLQLQIGVDESVVESARKLNRKCRSVEKTTRWLTEQCLLDGVRDNEQTRVLMSGPRDDDDLDAFVLHGAEVRVFVRKVHDHEEQVNIWSVDKVTRTTGSTDTTAIALGRGTIEFVDTSRASQVRASLETQLEELRNDRGTSFLKLWETYGKLEFEEKLSHARRIGSMAYENWSYTNDGKIRFDLTEPKIFDGHRPRIDALEVAVEPPRLLAGRGGGETKVSAFKGDSLQQLLEKRDYKLRGDFDEKASNMGRRQVVIEPPGQDNTPPPEGYLYLSLAGDETNRERREKALKKIETGTSPMPQLALLMEGGSTVSARPGYIEPLTASVQQKVFGDTTPNHSQEQAISTALNTPDIAVIQGPPGTGKTTVVRAIVARLDEMLADSSGDTRKVLLSGFQHEAVKNVVEGLDVHGVPAVKFGGRFGEDGYREAMGNLEKRRQSVIDRLEPKIPEGSPTRLRRRVDELRANYMKAPRPPAETAELLERVLGLAGEHLSIQLRHDLRRVVGKCRREGEKVATDSGKARLIARVRSLRSQRKAFADDGPRNAGRLLLELTRGGAGDEYGLVLTEDEKSLLERLAYSDGDRRKRDLEEVDKLRRRLLEQLIVTDERRHRRAQVREDVVELLNDVSDELVRRQQRAEGGVDAVAAQFFDVLDREPFEYRDAIYEMTPVWGATCQQAASHGLARVHKEYDLEYDTVIIDEAARANPLDLFIPMTQAKRRIILVGDHRQLPQIIDRKLQRKLEDELETSDDEDTVRQWFRDKLEESLFEHLRDALIERGREDGFDYAVSLDAQYRTHPVLGEFISKNFYAGEEDGVKLRSPRPAEDFEHRLAGFEDSVAAWIDVPKSRGEEVRKGTSRARPVEAETLVDHLKSILDHPAAENLSFGVITYYGGQREVLWQQMCERGLAVETEDGFEIADGYRHLETADGLEERLRIGTVDGFQGREFDVVFLSMVRSNDRPDQTVKQKRGKYGHLMSPNRLNVSMSRQKRLLIVVGDSTMLDAPHAESAIGPLVNFHRKLCGGEYGVVIDDN